MINKFSVFFFRVIISFIQASDDESIFMNVNDHSAVNNITKVQLFYESLCPGCREFDTTQFGPTVKELHPYLDIGVYPYGHTKTRKQDGKYKFTCQHGPKECYGNMLHACAIDYLNNLPQAVLYNSCMMSLNYTLGSDDVAAKECGNTMNIKSKPIIACAKGDRGSYLLNKYGEMSKKVHYPYVPYVLINGVQFKGAEGFKEAVCKTFTDPPPACQ